MIDRMNANEQVSSVAPHLRSDINRCLYCGQPSELVWVHGHGQCSNCGINTEECCRGESCAFDQNQ